MEFRFLIAFLFISLGLSAQVYQTNNSPFNFIRGTKNDTILVIPRGVDTPAIGNTKFGAPTIGAIFYKTVDSTFWLRSATRWNQLTGGSGECPVIEVSYKDGDIIDTLFTIDCNNDTTDFYTVVKTVSDTSIYDPIIDSTFNEDYRIIYAKDNRLTGDPQFRYSEVYDRVGIGLIGPLVPSDTAVVRLTVNGRVLASTYEARYGSYRNVSGNGLHIGDTIKLTPVVTVIDDTTTYKPAAFRADGHLTRLDRWPVADVSGKLNISDTAGMLTPYVRGIYRKTGTDSVFARYSTGDFFAYMDSTGGGGGGSGTVTSVGLTMPSAFSVSGSPVTSFGTLAVTGAGNTSQLVYGDGTLGAIADITGVRYIASDSSFVGVVSGPGQNGTSTGTTGNGTTHVNKNIFIGPSVGISNTTGRLNVGIGNRALMQNTTGYANFALGDSALLSATTGYTNSAFGRYALRSLTTGYGNHGIGNEALLSVTEGYNNIAIGNNALKLITTSASNNNTVIGHSAASVTTSTNNSVAIGVSAEIASNGGIAIGSSAKTVGNFGISIGASAGLTATQPGTFIGASAGSKHSGSSGDVFIGANAGENVTNNGNNTAVGRQAMQNQTSGYSNTAVGYQTLQQAGASYRNSAFGDRALTLSTGNFNAAFGASSLFTNTTGSNNTAVGCQSLYNNQTGSGNTAIGVSALIGTSSALSGYVRSVSNNTIIGYEAGNNISASNNIMIGYRTNYNSISAASQRAFKGSQNIVMGYNIGQPDTTGNDQVTIGSGGVNWLQRFSGGQWLINNTSSAVTSATASAALEINGTTGGVLLPRLTATQGSALTAVDGLMIYVTDTNGTFTSIGFWGYENGAWVKL